MYFSEGGSNYEKLFRSASAQYGNLKNKNKLTLIPFLADLEKVRTTVHQNTTEEIHEKAESNPWKMKY